MKWRVAAWTHPLDPGGFHQREHSIPLVRFHGNDPEEPRGRCTITVAETYAWRDLISVQDPADPADTSLIRLYRDGQDNTTAPDIEYKLVRFAKRITDDGEAVVDLFGVDWRLDALDAAALRWFDWEAGATRTEDPDWIYGGRNELRNADFTDNPTGILNLGFEDGTLDPWWPGAVEGVSANATVQSSVKDTGSWAAEVDPLLAEGGLSTNINLFGGEEYTVTARVRGANGVTYQIGATGPSGIQAGTGASVVQAFDGEEFGSIAGQTHEAQKEFTGTGAFQTVTLTFTTAGSQTATQLSVREGEPTLDGSLFYVDNVTISGLGIGTKPWTRAQEVNALTPALHGAYDTFEITTDQAPPGHTHSIKIDPALIPPRYAGVQQVVPVKRNRTYTSTVLVYAASAADIFRLVMRQLDGDLIAWETATVGAAATWTEYTLTFDSGLNDQIIWRFSNVNVSGDPGIFYVGAPTLSQGVAASTIGTISDDIMDDAQTDHPTLVRLPYIGGRSYTATHASDGTAWPRDESVILRRGKKYGTHLFGGQFRELGYTHDLTPGTSPTFDPTDGEWTLDLYEQGNDGTDRTGTGLAFVVGYGVSGGLIAGRLPRATRWFAEGAGGIISEAADTAQEAQTGIYEEFLGDPDLTDTATLTAAAQQRIDDDVANRLALTVELDETGPTPYEDFDRGDLVAFNYPGTMTANDRRISEIALTAETTANGDQHWTATVTASRLLIGSAALKESVYRLLRAYENLPEDATAAALDQAIEAGAGGDPTIVVAASNASEYAKRRADFVCTGTDDEETINNAIDLLRSAVGGRIVLSEGTFTAGDTITIGLFGSPGAAVHLHGLGKYVTIIDTTATQAIDTQASGCEVTELTVLDGTISFDFADSTARNVLVSGATSAFDISGADCHLEGVTTVSNTTGIRATSGANGLTVEGFHSQGDTEALDLGNISHYTIDGAHIDGSTSGAIDLHGCSDGIIIANIDDPGTGVSGAVRLGNGSNRNHLELRISEAGITAVYLEDSSDNHITAYVHAVSSLTDDTHDVFELAGDSNRNHLSGLARNGSGANRWRYGVNDSASTVDDTRINNLDLDETATADIAGNGTGTKVGPGGHEWDLGPPAARTSNTFVRWNGTGFDLTAVTGSGGTDTDAIHDNVANEIHAIAEKTTLADADELLLEDSAASWAKKRVTKANLLAGAGGGTTPTGTTAAIDTAQSISNTTLTTIDWDETIDQNDGSYWDAGSPSRLTADADGWYHAYLEVTWDSVTPSDFAAYAEILATRATLTNRTFVHRIDYVDNALTQPRNLVSVPIYLEDGDYIEARVQHNRGSALSLEAFSGRLTRMSLVKL